MGTRYGKRIVTDGLVLCLDAADNISAPHNDLPVKQGLVGWWDAADDSTVTLSGSNVTQWRDKSGNDLHMAPIGTGPTRSNTLNSKSILTFTTSQDVRNSDSELDLRSSDYTILIVSRYVNSGGTTATNRRILDGVSNNWLLGHWNKATSKYYALGWVSSSAVANNDNTWRIYTGDGNISADNWNIFANGTSATNSVTAGVAGPYYLAINSGQSSEFSECEVAELIVFNRVLSNDERTKVHNYLQNKWNIEVSDAKWYDRTANGNNGIFYNEPVYADTNKGYFEFDGADTYMQGSIDSSTFSGASSVSCWFKRHSVTSWSGLFSNNVSQTSAVLLTFRDSSNQIGINQSGVSSATIGPTLSNYLNKWIFCTLVLAGSTSGSSVLVYVYQDGNLTTTSGTLYWNLNTSSNYYIGRHWTNLTQIHDGYISQVLVHNKALSADEVAQNYNATKGRYL